MNRARVLLTHLRGGDYAHAGDKEAIDLVMSKALELCPEILNDPCLDVGSGFGGTAGYLQGLSFQSIHGIDHDASAIEYANKNYPECKFVHADVNLIPEIYHPDTFSLIYLFNVLYAIEDKAKTVRDLFSVAKPGAILALFDYTAESPMSLKDFAERQMFPIEVKQLKTDLENCGWVILEITDLSTQFLHWYEATLDQLEEESLRKQFLDEDLQQVKSTFTALVGMLKKSQIGGAAIYAQKPSM